MNTIFLTAVKKAKLRNALKLSKQAAISSLLVQNKFVSNEDLNLCLSLIRNVACIVSRLDHAFYCVVTLLQRPDLYPLHRLAVYKSTLESFRTLVSQKMPKTHKFMMDIGALADVHLHRLFSGLFHTLLDPEVAQRVVDCYLLEGGSVVLRFAYAILASVKRELKQEHFRGADVCWTFIADKTRRLSFAHLLDIAYEKKSSTMHIGQFFSSSPAVSVKTPSTSGGGSGSSSSSSSSSGSGSPLVDDHSLLVDAALAAVVGMGPSAAHDAVEHCILVQSPLMQSMEGLLPRVFAALSTSRCAPSLLSRVFSSETDGWSLADMLAKCDRKYPVFMVFKVESSDEDELLGVYLSGPLVSEDPDVARARDEDGLTFVFRHIGNNFESFRHSVPAAALITADSSSPPQPLIAVVTPDFISIGPSVSELDMDACDRTTAAAVVLEADLRTVRLGESDRFGNPVLSCSGLVVEEEEGPLARSGQFIKAPDSLTKARIECLEVFTGNSRPYVKPSIVTQPQLSPSPHSPKTIVTFKPSLSVSVSASMSRDENDSAAVADLKAELKRVRKTLEDLRSKRDELAVVKAIDSKDIVGMVSQLTAEETVKKIDDMIARQEAVKEALKQKINNQGYQVSPSPWVEHAPSYDGFKGVSSRFVNATPKGLLGSASGSGWGSQSRDAFEEFARPATSGHIASSGSPSHSASHSASPWYSAAGAASDVLAAERVFGGASSMDVDDALVDADQSAAVDVGCVSGHNGDDFEL